MKISYLLFLGLLLLGVALLCLSVEAKPPRAYYVAGTDMIIVIDGNATSPNTMATIYAEEVAHAWGQVTRMSDCQYRVDANIRIGNSTSANNTYFKSKNEQIVIEKAFTSTTYSTVVFGEWETTLGLFAKNGSSVIFNQTLTTTTYYDYYGTLLIYGSSFYSKTTYCVIRTQAGSIVRFNSTIFNHFSRIRNYNTDIMVYNSITIKTGGGWYLNALPSRMWYGAKTDEVIASNQPGRITLWYPEMYNSTSSYAPISVLNAANILEIINPINLKRGLYSYVYLVAGTDNYGRINYTIDLKVTNHSGINIQNARVKIWNVTGVLIYNGTTDANGRIPQTMLPYLKCKTPNAGGIPTVNETYNPYRITINKTGYTVYNESFTANYPINWTIALQNGTTSTVSYFPVGGGSNRTNTFILLGGAVGCVLGFIFAKKKRKKQKR